MDKRSAGVQREAIIDQMKKGREAENASLFFCPLILSFSAIERKPTERDI